MKRGILFYYKGSDKIPYLYCFSDCSSVIKGESDELKVRKTKNDKFKTMHFLDNQKNKIYLWDEDKFYYANQNNIKAKGPISNKTIVGMLYLKIKKHNKPICICEDNSAENILNDLHQAMLEECKKHKGQCTFKLSIE